MALIIVDLEQQHRCYKRRYKTTIVVSGDAPDNLYYYCQIHSGMGGAINHIHLNANNRNINNRVGVAWNWS